MDRRDLVAHFESMSSEKILENLETHRDEFTQEAVASMKEVLSKRIPTLDVDHLDDYFRNRDEERELARLTREAEIRRQASCCNVCGSEEIASRIPFYWEERHGWDFTNTILTLAGSAVIGAIALPLVGRTLVTVAMPQKKYRYVPAADFPMCCACLEHHAVFSEQNGNYSIPLEFATQHSTLIQTLRTLGATLLAEDQVRALAKVRIEPGEPSHPKTLQIEIQNISRGGDFNCQECGSELLIEESEIQLRRFTCPVCSTNYQIGNGASGET
jgi:hypothetical protein